MRLQALMAAAFAPVNREMHPKLSLSLIKQAPGLAELRPPGPATTGPILVAQNRKGFVAGPH
jgi:hypothetical protein